MIETMIFTILKILILIVLLSAMVMVLLGIRHISNPLESASRDETDALKREVRDEADGISQHSVFRQFLSGSRRR